VIFLDIAFAIFLIVMAIVITAILAVMYDIAQEHKRDKEYRKRRIEKGDGYKLVECEQIDPVAVQEEESTRNIKEERSLQITGGENEIKVVTVETSYATSI